jgi:transposase
LPADLPRVDVVHDLPAEEKVCGCGEALVKIGEEVSEKLDIIPQKVRVVRYIRPKYACRACEGSGDEGNPAVRIAPLPQQIIPKGIASAGLLAFIITSKYCDALPYYRQAKMFARIGIEIPRSTMCEWVIEAAKGCEPLVEAMRVHLKAGPVVQMDETPVQVLGELGKKNTSKSYMWVARGGDLKHPLLLYQYHRSRSKEVANDFLADYKGYLQTDGYAGYDEAGSTSGITHVGCWAHVRRKFFNAKSGSKKVGSADEALSRIGKLYMKERSLRELLHAEKITEDEFQEERKAYCSPVLEQFHAWLTRRESQVPPSTLLGKAVNYTIGQWPKLVRYLDAAALTPDTNQVENAIRPFVVGRKNWLFSGSPKGALASSVLYSLVESAKANNIEPYRYLRFLFEQIPKAETKSDFQNLLPHRASSFFNSS